MHKPVKKMVSLAVIAMMTHQASHAGGFSLYTESSAAAIGNYAAGIAAEGADASIGWYNPAGLVLIKDQQILLGGVGVFPSSKLTGTSTFSTSGFPPAAIQAATYKQLFNDLQGANSALVPSLHYALPLGERAVFGLSILSPFGLSTDYPSDSPVRYAATLSKLETLNVSPEIGGKLTDHFSVGLGLDLQYAKVNFNSMIGAPTALQYYNLVNPDVSLYALDSSSNNSGDSFGVGFHAGAMFMFDENHTRIGVNYQSAVSHQFNGTTQLTGKLADPTTAIGDPALGDPNARITSDALYSNNIDLPRIVTLSGYRDINARLALLGSVVYTGWSSFKTITLNNVVVGVPTDADTTIVSMNPTTDEDYRNAWRFAVGANYHVTEQWMMRVGGGYDQTPTVNAHRDVRLPDSERWALSIGAHYQVMPSIGVDAGYTYLFGTNDAPINSTIPFGDTSTYNVNATSKSSAQLVGLQVVWKIDQVKAGITK